MDLAQIDAGFWLAGDEDTGVGLNCRDCDRGGAPVAYLVGISSGYPEGSDVVNVKTIAALLDEGVRHLAAKHNT